jgi:colanic acid biosynthesis glycosyl transferase WcaI
MARVIFVNRFFHPDLSATSQMLSDLVFRLEQADVEVHVVCSRQLYENPAAQLPARERVGKVRVHRVWTARFGRNQLLGRALDYASFYLTCTVTLLGLARRDDILVVKTDPPLLSIVGALVARTRGAKLVNWLQDVFPEVASRLGMAPWPRWFEHTVQALRDRSMAQARVNVVLGERMRDYFIDRGLKVQSLRIIANWADGVAVTPKPAAASELRRRLGLQDHFVVGYSGNLGRAHEYETLMAAAQWLRAEPQFVFLMIGGGALMASLQQRVRELQLPNFRFLPYQPRESLADSLAAADVHLACLLPELEGLIVPSKVYGVFAAGRPIGFIGALDGELPCEIRGAECGFAVKCGAGADLVTHLRELRIDDARRLAMGARARRLFEERHTLEHAVSQWLDLLSDLELRPVPAGAALVSSE